VAIKEGNDVVVPLTVTIDKPSSAEASYPGLNFSLVGVGIVTNNGEPVRGADSRVKK
jgi:hypothetical protein